MNKSKLGLMLAAAAAYGVFKYSKLSKEQKSDLMNKGKDFLNKNLGGLTDRFTKTQSSPTSPNTSGF